MKNLRLTLAFITFLAVLGIYPLLQTASEAQFRAFSEQQQLTADDGSATDFFGFAVAIDGDTALIGAFSDDVGANLVQGSAYVYVREGSTWTQQQQLFADDGATSDQFGSAVALDGDTALITASFDGSGAGAVYVFVRSGTTWTQQQKLTADDVPSNRQFGKSVAVDGDTALIGATNDDAGATTNQGAAYVFVRSGTTWTQQQKLLADDAATDDNFGVSVDLVGDTGVIGATFNDVGATANQGSAYVFVRSGTTWTQQQQLTADDGGGNDFFGADVAIDGETVLVGANGHDVGANVSQGAAYVFVRSGTTWTQQQQLTADDGANIDNFGSSVALDGNIALVSSTFDDVGANADQGSAYVFSRSGTTWTQHAKLTASDGAAGDNFGKSVAFSGESALIGVSDDQVGANTDQGSAYVFFDPALVPTATPTATATATATDEFPSTPTFTPTATLEPGTTELIVNGGFETLDGEGKPDVTPWVIKNASGDDAKCNKDKDGDGIPDKIVAFAGNCAFQFKNVDAEAGKVEQLVDLSVIVPAVSDTVYLSFFAQSKGGATVKAKVVFKYADDTKTKISVETSSLENYTEFIGSASLTGADITKAKISFKSNQTTGKVYVDEVSLQHTVTSGLIAVPGAKLNSSTR